MSTMEDWVERIAARVELGEIPVVNALWEAIHLVRAQEQASRPVNPLISIGPSGINGQYQKEII